MNDRDLLRRRHYRNSGVSNALSIAEIRHMALRRLPAIAAEYLEGGAEDELTMARNRQSFANIELMPRLVCGEAPAEAGSGRLAHLPFPYVIAPTGLNALYWPKADLLLAHAAADHGVPFVQSTVSNCSIEEIAGVAGLDHWFQLYIFSEMDFVETLLRRAAEAGVTTLVVTIDANTFGNREWNSRLYGRSGKPRLRTRLDALRYPAWLARVGIPGLPGFPNLADWLGEGNVDMITASRWIHANMAARVTWDQLEHVRKRWSGTMLIKGICHPTDAERGVAIGADGMILGNHGGRQLDGAIPGATLLPEVRLRLGKGPLLMVEGGIRRGSDILKARLIGADAVMSGRSTLYGVAAGGGAGASRALRILHEEYERAAALLGDGVLHFLK